MITSFGAGGRRSDDFLDGSTSKTAMTICVTLSSGGIATARSLAKSTAQAAINCLVSSSTDGFPNSSFSGHILWDDQMGCPSEFNPSGGCVFLIASTESTNQN